jgi:hypothetical protein
VSFFAAVYALRTKGGKALVTLPVRGLGRVKFTLDGHGLLSLQYRLDVLPGPNHMNAFSCQGHLRAKIVDQDHLSNVFDIFLQ